MGAESTASSFPIGRREAKQSPQPLQTALLAQAAERTTGTTGRI
jgi:hypothetical protein